MKKTSWLFGLLVITLVMGTLNVGCKPSKLTEEQINAIQEAEQKVLRAREIAAAEAKEKGQVEDAVKQEVADKPEESAPETVPIDPGECPDVFKVKFECSNGDFVMECHKEWSPIGVQHFYDLVKLGYYDGCKFFRVVTGFVVQFGLPSDPAMYRKYGTDNIQDEPVNQSNTEGMVSYAMGGPNTRSTQVFINLGDNQRLDGMGFAPFAKIVEGMDVIKDFNAQYQDQPTRMQDAIQAQGNAYLDQKFPGLDYVKKATIIE